MPTKTTPKKTAAKKKATPVQKFTTLMLRLDKAESSYIEKLCEHYNYKTGSQAVMHAVVNHISLRNEMQQERKEKTELEKKLVDIEYAFDQYKKGLKALHNLIQEPNN